MIENCTSKILASQRQIGLAVIDLLIAFVILAVLISIAYPSYASHMRKAHRTEAKAVLMETVQYMERYYTTHNTYVGAKPSAISATAPRNAESERARYLITFADDPTATTYTLQATPVNVQTNDECGTLTVNHLGSKMPFEKPCW
jgi:type IV pilus assembly protein PilE